MELADGSAVIFAEKRNGDGCLGYKELLTVYENDEKKLNWLQEIQQKLKLIQCKGVKNYSWTKFGNALETICKEMDTLGYTKKGNSSLTCYHMYCSRNIIDSHSIIC